MPFLLLVGSEGTLAVTSQVTLKLVPPPKASKAMMALFKDMQSALLPWPPSSPRTWCRVP